MKVLARLHRHLDAVDTMAELIFGLLMVLTFTLGVRLVGGDEPVDGRELLLAALGCNIAWGTIDAFLYLLACVYERREDAPSTTRVRVSFEDIRGAVLIFCLVAVTAVPAAVPFMMIDDAYLALRVSNGVLVSLLFLVGFFWGRYVGARPWLSGMLVMLIGVALVLIAIPLGG
jgi:VIT1/CCC1 family predicted Fe2+/Mn2+ transporter